MNKRQDFTVRFAENGIIVQTYRHPGDYSRDTEAFEELVFNKLIDFERWFERHSDMNHVEKWDDLSEMTMGELAEETDYDLEQKVFIKPEWIRRATIDRPLVMGVDPAAPGEDKTVMMDAGTCAIAPLKREGGECSEDIVDALREAENVVKRFTGVKP